MCSLYLNYIVCVESVTIVTDSDWLTDFYGDDFYESPSESLLALHLYILCVFICLVMKSFPICYLQQGGQTNHSLSWSTEAGEKPRPPT